MAADGTTNSSASASTTSTITQRRLNMGDTVSKTGTTGTTSRRNELALAILAPSEDDATLVPRTGRTCRTCKMSWMLSPGTVAPDFELQNEHRQPVKLSSFRGRKNFVIAFHPLAFTPVCSQQMRTYEQEKPR